MHQLTQLAGDVHRQRLTHANQQRPAERLLGLHRATRGLERARRGGAAPTARPAAQLGA